MRRAVRWCWHRTVPALWVLSVLSLVGLLGSAPPVAATPVGPAHASNYDESAAVAHAGTTAHSPGESWDAFGADGTAGRSPVVDRYVYDSFRSLVAPNTGGTTLVADYAVSIRVAERAPVAPGQHNVVLHGDANGFVGASVDDVAAAVRADAAYSGQPICLVSCNSASNGSAQALATQLDVPVQAPTGLVGVPRPPAVPEVMLGPGSEWVWFYPEGPR